MRRNKLSENDLRQRIAQIYVKWNNREISGDEAIFQIRVLVRKECHEAWLKNQGYTKLGVKAK